MAATAGNRSWAVRNVPDLGGFVVAPSDLGKNSYQLLVSARSRWTESGNLRLLVTRSRSGYSSVTAVSADDSAVASRASPGLDASRNERAVSSSSGRPGCFGPLRPA